MREYEETRVVDSNGIGEGGYIGSRIVYYVLGIVEFLLAFRLLFKLLGANSGSGFVSFIYNLTQPLVAPFYGIFRGVAASGSILEPATIIAMLVYSLIAWGIARLIYTVSHGAHHRHVRF